MRIGRVRFFHSWPTWDLLMINFINFTRVQPESIMEFLTGQKVNLQPMFILNISMNGFCSMIYIWSCLWTRPMIQMLLNVEVSNWVSHIWYRQYLLLLRRISRCFNWIGTYLRKYRCNNFNDLLWIVSKVFRRVRNQLSFYLCARFTILHLGRSRSLGSFEIKEKKIDSQMWLKCIY